MRTAGIISEYNPFHRGHAWQIGELRRRLGAETAVVCAMSGSFVQRGDFAVMRTHARAEAAVRGSADLVLELPLPWAIASAEGFAAGGVGVLAATGAVDTLVFGSECGDTETLKAVAAALESDAFAALLRQRLAEGTSFAAAREAAARKLLGEKAAVLAQPNDILGVEYCKAIARQAAALMPLALPRRGVGHDGGAAEGFASASRIRELLINGACADEFLTPESAAICARECAAGRAPVTMANAERAILARLRAMREDDFAPFDGGGEGFTTASTTPCSARRRSTASSPRRSPSATPTRGCGGCCLPPISVVTPEDARQRVPYLRVLACNARGREVLRCMKTTAAAPVLTRSADVRRLDADAQRLFTLTARAEEQYVLAYPSLAAAKPGSAWTTDPVIL
ncbi:MAG: nucleotidyltransferase family protein [Oscillospiraceae bacterium]